MHDAAGKLTYAGFTRVIAAIVIGNGFITYDFTI